jgi:hypothetical protein
MKGKVQTNKQNINILLSVVGGNHQHFHYSDFEVECEVMSDEEIRTEYRKRIGEPTIKDMKDKLKIIEGFAISDIIEDNIKDNDLVKFKRIEKS